MDQQKLVQEQIEASSGIGQSSVSRILKGQTAVNLDTIEALARGLGIQAWELLVDDEETREAALRRILGGAKDSKAA